MFRDFRSGINDAISHGLTYKNIRAMNAANVVYSLNRGLNYGYNLQ